MSFYFCPEPVILGGKPFIVGNCLSIEENRQFVRKNAEIQAKADEPPATSTLRSKALPRIRIPAEFFDEIRGSQVPKQFLPVLNWLVKKDFYLHHSRDVKTNDGKKKLETEIRAKLVLLIQAEDDKGWPVIRLETDDSDLQKLNALLGKIDLGRRADLKYGHPLDDRSRAITDKYRQVDIRQAKFEKELAKKERRQELAPASPEAETRPWLRQPLLD